MILSKGLLVVFDRIQLILRESNLIAQNGADADLVSSIGEGPHEAIHVIHGGGARFDGGAVRMKRRGVCTLLCECTDAWVPYLFEILFQWQLITKSLYSKGRSAQVYGWQIGSLYLGD
jgi:hypothetical protein